MNLKEVCIKFLKQEYSIEDLSRFISSVDFQPGQEKLLSDAEYALEKIRFCVSKDNQYFEAKKVVEKILKQIKKQISRA